MWRSILTLSLCLLAAAATGCGTALVRVSESFALDLPWDNYQRVVVRTHNGHVELLADETEALRVSGVKRAGGLTWGEAQENLEQLTIIAKPDGADSTTFLIELDAPDALRNKSIGASFDIHVPQPCAADIATDNGHIRLRGGKDSVLLRTSNGQITIEQVDGRIEAYTSNGLIHATFIAGDLYADTCNGRIIVDTIDGDCRLDTSNGRIRVRKANGSLRAITSNGSISVTGTPPPDGEVVLRTSNGSITADLPSNLRGTLDIHTSNGRVSTNLGSASLTGVRWSKQLFEAEMNGGGDGRISARTSNGSITLNCR
jgi:DUF4097 and DUF4098 domain-containing protein YvlB